MRERPFTVLAGNKLALVADAVVAAVVRPLRVLAAHVATPAVIAWFDSLHTHILSSGPRRDFVTQGVEQRFFARSSCTKLVLDTDFVTKGHRFSANPNGSATYECLSCGMGNFTREQIAACDLFVCSQHLDRQVTS